MNNVLIYNDDNLKDNEIDEVITRVKVFIINDNNEILFANSGSGIQLIGGHVKHSETYIQAIKREVYEETGITFNETDVNENFFEIKYYVKNHNNSGKNMVFNVLYYYVKTNQKPNIKKTKLTKREEKNKFECNYVTFEQFENLVKSHLNNEKEINKTIAQEILTAFKELKKILHK